MNVLTGWIIYWVCWIQPDLKWKLTDFKNRSVSFSLYRCKNIRAEIRDSTFQNKKSIELFEINLKFFKW